MSCMSSASKQTASSTTAMNLCCLVSFDWPGTAVAAAASEASLAYRGLSAQFHEYPSCYLVHASGSFADPPSS